MRLSIRVKILAALSILLIGVAFAYLVMVERVFREDKLLLVFDFNRSSVERSADQIDGLLRRVRDKVELISQLILHQERGGRAGALAQSFFEQDPEILMFRLMGEKGRPRALLKSQRKLGFYQADPAEIEKGEGCLPLSALPSHTEFRIENCSTERGIFFKILLPIQAEEHAVVQSFVAEVLVDGKGWLIKTPEGVSTVRGFAVTPRGRILVASDPKFVLLRADFKKELQISDIRSGDFMHRQVSFTSGGKEYLGASRKTQLGDLSVFSVTDKQEALASSRILLEKTLVLSSIIVTVVFLFSLLFANSLSEPIKELVAMTTELARGNFEARVRRKSRDELGELADAFERMAGELKSSHAQLAEYNKDLEKKVRSRTVELQRKNEAIRKQHEELLQTARLAAVGETAGHAAHEILNPITGIISRLEAMSLRVRKFLDPQTGALGALSAIVEGWQSEYKEKGFKGWLQSLESPSQVRSGQTLGEEDLQNISEIRQSIGEAFSKYLEDMNVLTRESNRIVRIVQGMRGLARTSKVYSVLSARDLAQEIVEFNRDILAKHSVRASVHEEEVDAPIRVDTDEMHQIFSNLVRNSIDAIEERRRSGVEGEGLLEVKVGSDGDSVVFRLRDNGIGIERIHWEKIFDPNYSTKGKQGTGFGLSICRRLVQEAGGKLRISASERNKFTEFEIRLKKYLGEQAG